VAATERVRALLQPAVEAAGLVLEDLSVTPAGRRRVVRVVVDLPADATGGLDLDRVAEVSRTVSAALDADDEAPRPVLGGQPYVLEVTSPGVDRPLTERRHWARARGRLVTVPVADGPGQSGPEQAGAGQGGAGQTGPGAGGTVTGRVTGVDDDGVVLDVDGSERRVGWDALGRGRVQVELSRPDGDVETTEEG
jgi:ribosome maturation factor RimP